MPTHVLAASEPPVAFISYSPDKPMVGGNIILSAEDSYDPDGGDPALFWYEWYIYDDETAHQLYYRKTQSLSISCFQVFRSPIIYEIHLIMTDDEGNSGGDSIHLDLTLENGDILVWRQSGQDDCSWWFHGGIYNAATQKVIEARFLGFDEPGVLAHDLLEWSFPKQTCVTAVRVNTDAATKAEAVDFAVSQIGALYDWRTVLNNRKDADNSNSYGWYCNELVWAAYLNASEGSINLDWDDGEAVQGDELVYSKDRDGMPYVETVGSHMEDVPEASETVPCGTLLLLPTVTTNNAGNVFSASAILRGTLDSLGTASSINVSFQWTTDAHYAMHGDYDNETSPPWPMTLTGVFSFSLTGLSPDTTYHFRARAVVGGIAYGDDMVFTTAGPGSDGDGIPSNVEDTAPNDGDGNYDGTPDSEQSNVASLPNAANGQYATIESPSGTSLTNVAAVSEGSLQSQGKPNLIFPQGFFSFDINGIPSGSTVWVNLRFVNPVPAGSQYWKYGPTTDNHTPHWYQITMNSNDGDNVIQIPLIDGGLGDDDRTENGVIVDQGGPGNPPSPGGGGASGVPIFPSIYVGIGAAMGAGVVAYLIRRKVVQGT